MGNMFSYCTSLAGLPDISIWNISNVTNTRNMFNINVIDMRAMFYECTSLSFLPDISKWATTNVTNMRSMFYGCTSLLLYLPG